MRDDLQPESSGWLFKSPLAGGGGILRLPHSLFLGERATLKKVHRSQDTGHFSYLSPILSVFFTNFLCELV